MIWRLLLKKALSPIQSDHPAFNLDIDIITDRKHLIVIGENGSGKSTLIKALLGSFDPIEGRVTIGKKELFNSSKKLYLDPKDRALGYMPQHYALFPTMSVKQNIIFALKARYPKKSKQDYLELAMMCLKDLDVLDLANHRPHQLSGGQAQRVALARALAVNPIALLLDEPLAALDVTLRRQMRNFLKKRVQETKLPLLLVTHEAQDIRAFSDQAFLLILEQGKVIESGPANQIIENPQSDFAKEIFEFN